MSADQNLACLFFMRPLYGGHHFWYVADYLGVQRKFWFLQN